MNKQITTAIIIILLFIECFCSPSIYATEFWNKKGNGYIVLKEGVPLAKQMRQENTIYVIRHDFDLGKSANLIIPANCILEFEGGSINNGTIVGDNTTIAASPIKIFDINTTLEGIWNVGVWYPEWYGAVGDGATDDTKAFQKLNGKSIQLSNKTYLCTNLVFNSYTCIFGINKFNSCLKQKDYSTGDFIRLEDWFGGTLSDFRIEGGSHIASDSNLWMQALLKIVNYTAKHNPDAPGEYDGQDMYTNYSTINNLVIRHSEHTGLAVLGQGTDNGKQTLYNWIHHFSNIWVERCDEYGIYDGATDNQWSNINVSRCGYSNMYISGSSELYSNVKLDGESGYRLDGRSSSKILENRYNGAGLVLIGGNNIITGLDIQSIKYKGLILDSSRNIIIGSINNVGLGFKNSKKDQRNCPAVYLYGQNDVESNTLILCVYGFSEAVGTCVIRNSTNTNKIYNNQFNITYRPFQSNYSGDDYKEYINDLKSYKKNNTVIFPNRTE